MKDRKKRAQREEVRKILHAMRLELAAQRVAQEHGGKTQILAVSDLLKSSRATLGRGLGA